MAQKCVRQGCGKNYTDIDETCVYHPGPPIFHEGQKGTYFRILGSRSSDLQHSLTIRVYYFIAYGPSSTRCYSF